MAGFAAATLGPQSAGAIDLGGIEFGFGNKNKFDIPPEDNPDGLRSPRPLAYRVEYTDPPTTVPFPKKLEVRLGRVVDCSTCLFYSTRVHRYIQAASSIMSRHDGNTSLLWHLILARTGL